MDNLMAYASARDRGHLIYNGMPPTGLGKATSWLPSNSMPPQAVREPVLGGRMKEAREPLHQPNWLPEIQL
jgi:hypothetical protein